jgi:hypothetical protein
MEIKDILKELIVAANATLSHNGHPENFDLEDFISTLEAYYEDLDDVGEFTYYGEVEDDYSSEWDERDENY